MRTALLLPLIVMGVAGCVHVDKERARKAGVSPGGMIMIHGQSKGFGWWAWLFQMFDWTNGCIAVTDDEMKEIWDMVVDGTPIEISP